MVVSPTIAATLIDVLRISRRHARDAEVWRAIARNRGLLESPAIVRSLIKTIIWRIIATLPSRYWPPASAIVRRVWPGVSDA